MRIQHGFTLLETMVVAGIIGTVASLAIPAYADYLGRSQVSEAVRLLSGVRVEASEQYANTGAWPAAIAGVTSGKYTASVTLSPGTDPTAPALTITATMKEVGVQRAIAGKTLELVTADGGAHWACRAGTLAEQHVPGACKGR